MKRKTTVWLAVIALALIVVPFAFAAATNSSTDPGVDVSGVTSGDCARPAAATPVNCNEYTQKQDVFLNGSPSKSDAGTYFFAVLVPGGQADPNDGAAKNLSDGPNGFSADNREFTVDSSGNINRIAGNDFSYAFDATGNGGKGSLSVYPFDDTTNPGGVYILATCKISDSLSQSVIPNPSAQGGDCKYDAFKVGSAFVPTADDLTVTKDANGADTETWTWGIQKSVDKTEIDDSSGSAKFNYTVSVTHDSGTVSGVQVTGTITVFNPNNDGAMPVSNVVPVDITGVTDQLSDGTDCTVANGGPQTLTEATTTFDYSCDLSSLPQGQLDNTVTVSWDGQLLSNGAFLGANSADFTFQSISFDQTNVDDCVAVSDTLAGSLGNVCQGDPSPTDLTYSHTFSGDPAGTCKTHDNTATFTTNTSGTTDSSSQTVKQCVGADLTVGKTASPAFKRTYNWSISKDVDKTRVEQLGGTATFNYSVTAAETGFTDSNWVVTGTITVTNPNDWEDVPVTISDAINNGGTCTIDGLGASQTVPAGKSVTATYTCTYSSAPSPLAGTNTGRADWNASTAFTPDAFATGTAGATFGAPTSTVKKTITVTDTFNGGSPTTLGTLTATDTTPYTSKTYTYGHTVSVPSYGCVSYSNTAKIVETNQTAGKTVQVCGPARTGALTIGYWQNKNGQGIITSGASTSGACNSGTWLRTFAPFQDLSSTASCSAVATYVYNLIKAANASGSAMNAMLKAQMLATALDVYFSTPSLGGNPINSPVVGGIGGVTIDLTKICKMADSSSGGSCTSSFQNASPAFGGATSKTVLEILQYAASQSNVGGTTWYAQNKATQQLAKDTFDAINNQVAFAL